MYHGVVRWARPVFVLAIAIGLAACGGGSGGTTNRPPQLTATSFSGDEETTLSGRVTASDPEGDSFTLTLARQPNHGSMTFDSDGTFVFQPDPDFFGAATFGVVATDARGATATHQISIEIRNVNDAPIAHDDEVRVGTGTVTLSLLANDVDVDGDNLLVTPLSQPPGGTVSVSSSNVVTFQPENAFAGPTTFNYRITDAAGVTADATAKLVVGDFPGIVFLADETTPGTRELHFYDGFRTVCVSSPLQAGARIDSFTLASDRRHVAYTVHTVSFEQVFIGDIGQPGAAQHVYTTSGAPFSATTTVTLNRDASYALIGDSTHPLALKKLLVRTADASVSVLGASNPGLVQPGGYVAFNPVTDEFYVQAQVGGVPPPMSGTGYVSLFGASTSAPAPLSQLGASYVPDHGSGSGHLLAVTPDGQRVLHIAFTSQFPATGYTTDLLVNHRPSNSESYAYRPFALFEYVTPVEFRLSNDGARVCYILNDSPGSAGPTRVWFSDLSAPANGAAVSPPVLNTFGCRWADDNQSIVYLAAPASAPYEVWVADALQPGTARRLREPLTAGEQLDYFDVARRSMTAVFGIRPSGSVIPDFYRASIDVPGSSVKFATGSFLTSGSTNLTLNPRGTLLAYAKSEPIGGGVQTIDRLHVMSTQTAEYDWVLSRPDASAGVLQFEFVASP